RELVFVVIKIDSEGEGNLLKIGNAGRALPALLGAAEGREQQSCENCDNGDDHQQLDQSEGAPRRRGESHGHQICGKPPGRCEQREHSPATWAGTTSSRRQLARPGIISKSRLFSATRKY